MTYDVLGPLPAGTTVLEASAGTGKTFTIVGLATRYVAEGHATLDQLMLVTFSRAATQELRERTRERLVGVAGRLADVASARTGPDSLVAHLAAGADAEVALRRARLLRAVSDFDAATIATTHSFCQQMLDGLGVAGEREPGAEVVEDVDDMVLQVVDDLYLHRYAAYDSPVPLVTAGAAREVARAAVRDRQAVLEPADAGADTEAGQRVALATAARAEVTRRKHARGVRDFDDLLVLLRDTLADPVRGPGAAARIRSRYRVVLVDEFQDTDPVQWEILRRAFHGTTTLVLIGDPKQAVYGFRGAEVLSYLDAVREASEHRTLTTSWRSDDGLLRALEHLYGGAALGHEEIVVHPVQAARPGRRLAGASPLRLRTLDRSGTGPLGGSGFPALAALRRRVADDLATEVVDLLSGGTRLDLDGAARPVEPGDIAVLVRRRAQIPVVQAALERAGVPSVLAGGTSVFETDSARDWLWVLQAMEQPHRAARVRLAALTPLVGRTATDLDARGDDVVVEVAAMLRELVAVLAHSGVAAVAEHLALRTGLESRLLGLVGGGRRLTDLRHVSEVLNRASVEDSLGLTALTGWLAERIRDPASGRTSDRTRRLEHDAAAVQVVTVHASKGLEFPVVLVPFGWDGARNPDVSTFLLHDDHGRRVLDVGGGNGPGVAARQRVSEAEDAGEELRLLYVALTRAMCQVVLWWAPGAQTRTSPLQRLLMGRRPGESQPAPVAGVPEDPVVAQRLAAWAAGADGVSLEPVQSRPVRRWEPAGRAVSPLAAAVFDRALDTDWRRTSYSALTAAAHDAPASLPEPAASEPEVPETTDEPAGEVPAGAPDPGGPASLMNALPSGAAFGTLFHEVLEVVDTGAVDLSVEVLRRCREVVAARRADIDERLLAAAVEGVLSTPLGTGTLAAVAPQDRLAELDFELPLAGGDCPNVRAVTLGRLAVVLREHLAADDPLAAYADALASLEAPPLRGFLAGSIDAVLRVRAAPGADPRYVVVDYKTNRLARGDLSTLHYTRAAMAAEMIRAHYPLQALLYSVALHRYLRWRQPGYDPARHLGGVQYLFVRAMVGPDTPPGCGVFSWHPPPGLVTALSDLLAGR